MAGTKIGGLKTAKKNLKSDPDFYRRIGAIGGRNGNTGGFAADVMCFCDEFMEGHQTRRCAGRKGGRNRRGWRKNG